MKRTVIFSDVPVAGKTTTFVENGVLSQTPIIQSVLCWGDIYEIIATPRNLYEGIVVTNLNEYNIKCSCGYTASVYYQNDSHLKCSGAICPHCKTQLYNSYKINTKQTISQQVIVHNTGNVVATCVAILELMLLLGLGIIYVGGMLLSLCGLGIIGFPLVFCGYCAIHLFAANIKK